MKEIATITAFALAIYDPEDLYDVVIFRETSSVQVHPSVSVTIPNDYALTGGGAQSHCDYSKGRC